jgi:hypothetical protein
MNNCLKKHFWGQLCLNVLTMQVCIVILISYFKILAVKVNLSVENLGLSIINKITPQTVLCFLNKFFSHVLQFLFLG